MSLLCTVRRPFLIFRRQRLNLTLNIEVDARERERERERERKRERKRLRRTQEWNLASSPTGIQLRTAAATTGDRVIETPVSCREREKLRYL
jgi:hypothetical protein